MKVRRSHHSAIKTDIESEMMPPPRNAYCFFRSSSQYKGSKAGNWQLLAARDEYVRCHGLTLADIPEIDLPAIKRKAIRQFVTFMRLTLNGKVPTGSVLIVDSLRSLPLNSTDDLYGTCRAIGLLMDHGIGVVVLDPLIDLKPSDDFMESVLRNALYAEVAERRQRTRKRNGT